MPTSSRRSIEIDFFRGLALIVIMLDHIPGSLLSHITLHRYAFCDAAEVFVFVGGYSVAAAFTAIQARKSVDAASQRFILRSWEIYRAFLLTAAFMVLLGLLIQSLKIDTAALGSTEARTFLRRPVGMIIDVLTLRRQPFLSSVLPMYALFALAAAVILPFANKRPALTFAGSVLMWAFAPRLATILPTAYPEGWAFNPFAWQIMFVGGALMRLHPATPEFFRTRTGHTITIFAAIVAALSAACVLFIIPTGLPGYEKQNLALLRLIDFAALAWLAALLCQGGRIERVALRHMTLVRVGQQSLACFIGGAVISLTIGTFLRPEALPHWLPARLLPSGLMPALQARPWWEYGALSDVLAIGALIAVALTTQYWKARQKKSYAAGRPSEARSSS